MSVLLDENINREEYIKELKTKGIDGRPFFYPLSDMEIYKQYCKNGKEQKQISDYMDRKSTKFF